MRPLPPLAALALALPAGAQPFRPLVADAAPARSCESLRTLSLPNTTVDSAVVDGDVCRVVAADTHPPETLTAVRREPGGQVVRSRPLCPYPLVARPTERGSTDDAASFACRAP